ncbi:MAG: SAM-dependent methyltransferase [Pseudonocardiaceae bacterium]
MGSTQEQGDVNAGVGLTALTVAAARALETDRADRLIDDPYAEAFVRAAAPPVPMPIRQHEDVTGFWAMAGPLWGVRSRFFDDYFADAVGGGARQVVVLAAGLDARAYRLEWGADTDFYEIDQPEVLEFKQQVLTEQDATPCCHRHSVSADLRQDWAGALRAGGFDPARPTAWLAEGLLLYLPAEAETTLFERVHELSAPGSRIAFDRLPPETRSAITGDAARNDARRAAGIAMPELWSGEQRRDCATWLRSMGWTITIETRGHAAEKYGRTVDGLSGLTQLGELVTARLPQ